MENTLARNRPPGEFVQSLERGLAVIRAVGARHPSPTLSDIARETGLSRAVARRFLHTLVELGYVATDGKHFQLRPRLLELGHAYLSNLGLPELVQPHLQRLSDIAGESTSVAVLDGSDIVYIARVAASRIMTVTIGVGTRFPAYATSMGRALLAFGSRENEDAYLKATELVPLTAHTITQPALLRKELARIRTQGWALVDQELEEGLRSMAAPLRDARGDVVAALNISAPVRRATTAMLDKLAVPLIETAQSIQEDITRAGIHAA